jgi:hypothetical protein
VALASVQNHDKVLCFLAIEACESVQQLCTNVPGETVHRALMFVIALMSHMWWFALRLLPLPDSVTLLLNGVFMPTMCEIC